MRTTIDIDDKLAINAKKLAVDRGSTLKALVEEGLKLVLESRPEKLPSPLEQLAGLGKEIWQGVHPDRFVRDSRRGWK